MSGRRIIYVVRVYNLNLDRPGSERRRCCSGRLFPVRQLKMLLYSENRTATRLGRSPPKRKDHKFTQKRGMASQDYWVMFVLLPILFFLLGIMLFANRLCKSSIEQRVFSSESRPNDAPAALASSPRILEESKAMLNFLIEAGGVQLTLDDEHFVEPSKCNTDGPTAILSGDSDAAPVTVTTSIRISRLPNRQPGQSPTVSSQCAICLENYAKGDTITGSTNPECGHAFHMDCIVGYLSHKATQKRRANDDSPRYPCPCCRNSFITISSA